MAINITDGFNLNYAAPVDYRMVVSNSTARLALTYKYDGLKVFQTDNRNTYLYNSGGSTWDIESYDKISGTGSTNYIPKFTGTNSTTGSLEIGNSPIFASGSNVGINTNNPTGAYTYLQIGGTSLTEDPYWYGGQSLPLTIHKGGSAVIGYNWYWTGSTDAYFNSAVGSSQILFSDNIMLFKTRPGSGSFVHNMVIYPGYVVFSDASTGGTTKSPMIRSQGSSSYSSQTTPDFTWYGDNTTGIFIPSANTIAFTNNGTESVRIESNGVFKLSSNGTVSDPVFSFVSSPTTGIFRPSANTIAFTNNGTESVRITSAGSVGIGVSPTTVHSSANLFNSSIPKLEVLVGNSISNYQELMVLRGLKGSATNDLTRVGVIMKLSDETGSGESDKMGGMILESTTQYSNYPSLHLVTSNQKRLSIDDSGNIYATNSTISAALSSVLGNKMVISLNDIYADIHSKGTNGIGDSGNNASPWIYPSIASGQFTLVTGDFTSATNCSSPTINPCLWHRTGNIVTVSGQISFTITSANVASTFKLKIPIPSTFGVDLGSLNGNNWQLNGVGKIVVGAGSNSGNISTIQAYGTSTAQFNFYPSMSGAVTMVYQYTYVVGTWPNTPAPPPPPPPLG